MKTPLRRLLALGLLFLTTAVFAQDPNLHIYLCFGQSNMEGYPGIPESEKGPVDPRFQVLAAVDFPGLKREQGRWYLATPPLSRPSAGLSPADYFGRTMVANLPANIRVGVVNVAVGGCKIELFEKESCAAYVAAAPEWMKPALAAYGGDPYRRLVEMGKVAQKAGVIKGILLHQGESNSGEADWPQKVKGVYENLLRDLGLKAAEVPLIAGELVPADQDGKCAGMNPIIAKLPETIPTAHVVSSAGCPCHPDHLHFTPEGYRELGQRYAAAMLPLLGLPAGPAATILTPPAPATPRVNGPAVFGVRPGAPFLYAIPATGQRPMTFAVDGLPAGLKVDSATGQITGSVAAAGEYAATLRATNALGMAEKAFRIVVGDRIALTPPMGWSSWNCWGDAVSQELVLSSARAMAAKGLRDHGWTYINIDDGWQAPRGGEFNAIQGNKKFPDMKALADEIHGLGLKFGIYSSPWTGTYAGYVGGSSDNADGTYPWVVAGDVDEFYHLNKDPKAPDANPTWVNWHFGQHSFAAHDARQWATWGVDYLKYDWFPNDVAHVQEMSDALRATGRDIVYSLSNTGLYDNAPDYVRLSNLWRTTGDIVDTWDSVTRNGFSQDRWAAYTGPGHWSDPDMLVLGQVGWGPNLHPTRLTPDEQYAHMSLWCLLSAPLLLGCDLAQIDDFTLGLLTNDEVLAIDQDPLGRQATQFSNVDGKVVYAKTLADGSYAVGLFNRGDTAAPVAVKWGPWGNLPTERTGMRFRVRDLWRQQDRGVFQDRFETEVAPHGVVLIRLIPAE